MVHSPRYLAAAALLASAVFAIGCGNGDDGTSPPPTPPLGVSVQAVSSSVMRVTFTSSSGINSYDIERAEGTGTFSQVGTVSAPAAAGTVTYSDTALKVDTDYRYRVTAVRGSQRSTPSGEATGRTLRFGTFTADIAGDITTSRTLFADTTYTLKGFIHVANGATLTIQAGTKIQGDFNTLGSSLFVLRGARITAIGRADAPIVFTSSRPAGQRQPGDWGGLIIVGNATLNRTGVDIELEGTATDNTQPPSGKNYRVTYSGGTTDTDNSGELRYVRVEFAGFAPSTNNELNTFTFAAVGSGTKLSFLQAMAGLDDSFEWFGGTVDATNLVSYEAGDDHFDMSEGYRGRLQYLIALQTTQLTPRTGAGSLAADPQGIENDGCEGAGCTQGRNSTPLTTPVVANFTLIGTGNVATAGGSGGVGMMLRRGVGGFYVNGLVARWPRAAISIRDPETFVRAGSAAIPNLTSTDLAVRNVVIADAPTTFQAPAGTTVQNSFDLTGNALVVAPAATTTASLFTAFPATVTETTTQSAFDWTPTTASPAAAGGMATFSGRLSSAAGTVVTGTNFVGAAQPGGTKWWQGWTVYAQK